jgi:anaerobic selenocysteine-containing dehydrogenase
MEIRDGRPVRVIGDRSYPLYGGYTCVKGRSLPKYYLDPNRLLFSMKKGGEADDPLVAGTNVNRLLRVDEDFDPITGSPLMGAVPVRVSAADEPI